MSRDVKPRRAYPAKKSSGGTLLGLFIGLVVGMLAVAGVVWYVKQAPLPFTSTGQQAKPAQPPGKATAPAAQGGETTVAAAPPLALPGKPGDPIPSEKPRFDFYKILPGKAEAIPDPKPEEPAAAEPRPTVVAPSVAKAPEHRAVEPRTAEQKPVEPKPVEARVAEPKATESKSAASKAAESKSSESKPAESAKSKSEGTFKDPVYLQAGSFQSASEADNQKARLALLGAEARIQQVMLQDRVWYRVRLGPYHKIDEVNHMRADLAKQGIEANLVKKE